MKLLMLLFGINWLTKGGMKALYSAFTSVTKKVYSTTLASLQCRPPSNLSVALPHPLHIPEVRCLCFGCSLLLLISFMAFSSLPTLASMIRVQKPPPLVLNSSTVSPFQELPDIAPLLPPSWWSGATNGFFHSHHLLGIQALLILTSLVHQDLSLSFSPFGLLWFLCSSLNCGWLHEVILFNILISTFIY